LLWHSVWNYCGSCARALAVVNHGKGRCSFWPWNCSRRHSFTWSLFLLTDRVMAW
jgi:hypothetical protein